jgi:hypothetical protein
MADDEPSGLDFDGLTPWFIHVYNTKGGEGLKALLNTYRATGRADAEHFEEVAAELTAMKLKEPAKLVRQVAAKLPSLTDIRFCPYLEPPYTDDKAANEHNISAWIASRERQIKRIRKRVAALSGQ